MGISTEKNLPVEWSSTKNLLWSSPLPGEGHASPIIWGDRVFVCTVKWADDVADRTKVIPTHHVTCYRLADGKTLWDTTVKPGPWVRNDFRSGPGGGYAAPTPATDGKNVFVVFGSSVIAALDFEGKIAWRKEIVPYTFDVTIGGSPILYGDHVLMFCAMSKKSDSKAIAFNKADGAVAWEAKLPTTGFGHSTPVLIDVKGKTQLLVLASAMGTSPDALQALDPATGKRIWWCRGNGDAMSPVFADGKIYFDSGRGSRGVAVDASGKGDVTNTHIRWTIGQVPSGISSPVVSGGYLYRLHRPEILKCWKFTDGTQVYSHRLKGITSTWASPIVDANSRLYLASAGKSYVIQCGPEFKLLAVNDLNDPNHASPAVSQGRMVLVGVKDVYCVGKK